MNVEWRAWDSRSELEEFLRKHSYRMLRRSPGSENEFYSVTFGPEPEESNLSPKTVGVCGEGHGLKPKLVPLPTRSGVLISIDDVVIAVDMQTGEDIFRVSLERSLVHSMISAEDRAKTLIFHEIGVALIDDGGKTLWNFSRDVVTSSTVAGDVIHLSFMDQPPAKVSIHSGLELSR